ncbi:MAG TPA: PhnD/SsuA/transferrin family substrate-binding protein [Stellaceae bacterium]|jgi:ABC-type phosphate/phosphonate transport system substrate-binding protein|nr:PhnD/SsuA/transferrin family substrate-binding protein [Stellaceae bacterium]
MTATASLPMYNLPEMRPVNTRCWQELRGLLIAAGLPDTPETPFFDRPPVPPDIGPEILFSQTCGYPLETIFRGQAIRLGTPCYDAPGCEGPTHRGIFVVPAASKAQSLHDLRGSTFLYNHRHSNSGMNLPRRALADIAGGAPLFAQVIETGSQPGNLDRIARGDGEATCVDCVTYAFWSRYRPELAQRVRMLGYTPPSPAIPFVTSATTPTSTVAILREALRTLMHDPRYAAVRDGLMMTDIVDVPDAAYRGLLDYEREAAELGYPQLA